MPANLRKRKGNSGERAAHSGSSRLKLRAVAGRDDGAPPSAGRRSGTCAAVA